MMFSVLFLKHTIIFDFAVKFSHLTSVFLTPKQPYNGFNFNLILTTETSNQASEAAGKYAPLQYRTRTLTA